MILFLRDKNNNTIVDLDCYKSRDGYIDITSTVCIDEYSKLLLSTPEEQRSLLITEFNNISELRGWLWESHFMGRKNTNEEYDQVIEQLRGMFKNVAKKYDLCYVED
jgi:hypothetical protein